LKSPKHDCYSCPIYDTDRNIQTIAERRRAPSQTLIPTKIHQRKPAIAGAISVFPPGTSAETDFSASSGHRPFSVINEDPTPPTQRLVPPAPPARIPTPKRPTREHSHLRNISAFSDDSSVVDDTPRLGHKSLKVMASNANATHLRSSSSISNWPFDIHSPKIDYGQSPGPLPKFKQHESPTPKVEELSDRLYDLTTSELNVSTFAKFESTAPRANVLAASYRALVENEAEAIISTTTIPALADMKKVDASLDPHHNAPVAYGKGNSPHFNLVSIKNHSSLPDPLPASSIASSTRTSNGNPFHWDHSPRSHSVQTISTTNFRGGAAGGQQYFRPRAGTDPCLDGAASVARSECGASTAASISTRRGASKTRQRNASSQHLNIARPSRDLCVIIPTPTLRYRPSCFQTPTMLPLPKYRSESKVEPLARKVEAAMSLKPVFKPLDWESPSQACAVNSPARPPDSVSPPRTTLKTEPCSNRASRDKDEETYNILSGLPPSLPPPRKKNNIFGSTAQFPTFSNTFSRTTSVKSTSDRDEVSQSRNKGRQRNHLMGSTERFPEFTDDSLRETSTVESTSDANSFRNPRLTTLKNLRYESRSTSPPPTSLPRPPPPSTIDSDLDPAITRGRVNRTRGGLPTSPPAWTSDLNDPLSTHFSQKKLTPKQCRLPFRSPSSAGMVTQPISPRSTYGCASDTTPSEIDAAETNQLLMQSFPALPTSGPLTTSSEPKKDKNNSFITSAFSPPETKTDKPSGLDRNSSEDGVLPNLCVNNLGRQGFGPGPSLSLLEKWERQGRSYITTHNALTAEEDLVFPPCRKQKSRERGDSDAVIYPPPESTRRAKARFEVAEIIPQKDSGVDGAEKGCSKEVGISNPWAKKPVRSSESARAAEAAGIMRIDNGSNTRKKVKPKKEEGTVWMGRVGM
jgi:hypothetical protein